MDHFTSILSLVTNQHLFHNFFICLISREYLCAIEAFMHFAKPRSAMIDEINFWQAFIVINS